MIQCTRCAEENPDNAIFCVVCGVKLAATSSSASLPILPITQLHPQTHSAPDASLPRGQGTALLALIFGIVAGAFMLMGLILIGIGVGIKSSNLGAFGILCSLLGVIVAAVAFLAGLVALARYAPQAGSQSRRHATLGITLGLASVLLCCVTGYLVTLLPTSTA